MKHVYTQEEIDLILNRFKNKSTFTCLFITACYTGMRPSEICALTWDDIDFEKRVIKVRHNVYSKIKDNKGRWFLGSTKTINGIRDIYISDTLYMALKNFKNRQDKLKKEFGKNYHYYHLEEVKNKYGKITEYRIVEIIRKSKLLKTFDLVFTKDNGTYNGTDITRYPYKVVHDELGIKNCRFYDLRGSFATKTLRSGVEIRDVANILGHSKVETTENYYISNSEETMKIANEKFDQIVKSTTINEIIKYK